MSITNISLIMVFAGFIAIELLVALRLYRFKFNPKIIPDIGILIVLMTEGFILYNMRIDENSIANPFGNFPVMILVGGLCLFIPTLTMVYAISELLREYKWRIGTINDASASVAFEQIDCGIMYTESDGSVVLVNSKMKEFSRDIFGMDRSFQTDFWSRLVNYESETAARIEFAGDMTFALEDGRVISVSRKNIGRKGRDYYEITAQDITDIYQKSNELRNKVSELAELEERLAATLENIADIQQERELLNYKYHIHDELGNVILRGHRILASEQLSAEEREEYIESWVKVNNKFMAGSRQGYFTGENAYIDIVKMAEGLGCSIEFKGDRPLPDDVMSLTIREAVYNAIKHSHAQTVFVEGTSGKDSFYLRISDDGADKPVNFSEGGGLGNIRRAIESAGGTLEIDSTDGVVLNIVLPKVKQNEIFL